MNVESNEVYSLQIRVKFTTFLKRRTPAILWIQQLS